jgi:hypothetical protein
MLRQARSVMFIDAHLNPSHKDYQEIPRLLQCAAHRNPAPTIEIHRVIYVGSDTRRILIKPADLEHDFRSSMTTSLRAGGLSVKVFIWDDFHDRHIISDLAGIHLGNGLKTTTSPAKTTWTRLGRDVRDEIQREFDQASGEHFLHHSFTVS